MTESGGMTEFHTPEPIDAIVELGVGDVQITADERADTVVTVRPSDPARRGDALAAEHTRVEFAAGRLVVRAPRSWRAYSPFSDGGSVDVEIGLPAGSRLTATTHVAAVRATGPLGDCKVKTAVGDIRLGQAGTVQLTTASGDIVVDRVAGDAELSAGRSSVTLGRVEGDTQVKSSSGDTRVGEAGGDVVVKSSDGAIAIDSAGASVTAKTARGDIRIGARRATVEAATAYGSIEVAVAAGSAAWLDLHTGFGHVDSVLEEATSPEPGESVVEVRARTSYGDITIRRAAAPAVPLGDPATT